mgnify:FL=1
MSCEVDDIAKVLFKMHLITTLTFAISQIKTSIGHFRYMKTVFECGELMDGSLQISSHGGSQNKLRC